MMSPGRGGSEASLASRRRGQLGDKDPMVWAMTGTRPIATYCGWTEGRLAQRGSGQES